jgi:hypothetical protein
MFIVSNNGDEMSRRPAEININLAKIKINRV